MDQENGQLDSPHKPPNGGGANFASCLFAAIALILLAVAAFTVYLTVLRPKDPTLTVNAVQVPSFSAANFTADFTFSQYTTVRNPNRAVFTNDGGSVRLLRAGNQVGYLLVPAGKIEAGGTQYITATFAVKSLSVSVGSMGPTMESDGVNGFRVGSSLVDVETRIEMAGRVRVLKLFTQLVESRAECRVAIDAADGSVLSFHC